MINTVFTLKQLEALVAVVDHGSFRQAAQALNTTQPNISARIAALEERLDLRLLDRDSGGVRLSPVGRDLIGSVRVVLEAAENFTEQTGRRDLITDRLRLGVTELIACTWLHDFLRQMHALYPGVSVELSVNLSHEIDRELGAGLLDLTIQSAPFEQSNFHQTALEDIPYQWLATPDLARQMKGARTLERFFVEPVLTHARNTLAPQALAQEMQARGLNTGRVVHNSSLSSCLQMAIDGMGVALLPQALAEAAVTGGSLQVLACDWHPPPLGFYLRYDPRRAAPFVKEAAKLAQKISMRK